MNEDFSMKMLEGDDRGDLVIVLENIGSQVAGSVDLTIGLDQADILANAGGVTVS